MRAMRGNAAGVAFLLGISVAACSPDPPPSHAPKTLLGEGEFQVALAEDLNRVRILTGLGAIAQMYGLPMKDGVLDVYELLEGFVPDGRHDTVESLLRSSRSGAGPSKKEIDARSYANFPWERCRAEDVRSDETFPLVWEKEPDRDGRVIVGLSNGAVKVYDRATLEAMLRR